MNDTELAEKVVALGVLGRRSAPSLYTFPDGFVDDTHHAVRDWRVAGALMKRCNAVSVARGKFDDGQPGWDVEASTLPCQASIAVSDSLPRAIIEACVTALEAK